MHTKFSVLLGRNVDEKYVPHLIELTKQTQQHGSTFEIDDKIICVRLRGAWGRTIGKCACMHAWAYACNRGSRCIDK